MRPINVEITMGHDIGLSASYYKPTEREVLEDHLKAVPLLTIYGEHLALQRKVEELREKSREENYIIKGKLSEKEQEIRLLRQRDSVNTDSIAGLSDQLAMVMQDIEDIKRTRIALQSVSEPSDD